MTQYEAFKAWWYNEGSQAPYTHHDCEEHTMRMCEIAWNKAQALAQPEQEPVAWMDEEMTCIFFDAERPEPFDFDFWKPLYTTPPQRKPLTDEEIGKILERGDIAERDAENGRWHVLPYSFARAIEQAHGIKE